MSNRYITDRFLPDKAIDLIDEAAARLRMEVDSKPEAIDELDRKHRADENRTRSVEEGTWTPPRRDRLMRLETELTVLEKQSADLTSRWKAEKDKLVGARENKMNSLKQARAELEQAQRSGQYTRAGELTYGIIPNLKKKLLEAQGQAENAMLDEVVKDSDIAAVVSRWTGIPVDKMLQGEREKLLKMEEYLQKRVIGQSEAVVAVSNAVRRARAGLQDPNRPIGSFSSSAPRVSAKRN